MMRHNRRSKHRPPGYPVRDVALVAALVTCVCLPACNKPGETPARSVSRGLVRTRAESVRGTADAILAECEAAAGGGWDRWQRDTEPYRAALKAKVEALKSLKDLPPPPGEEARNPEASYEVLEGKDNFPLFEVAPEHHLKFLYDADLWIPYRRQQCVVAAHRWLRARGIDLIFVPVPKMTEVYVEKFLDPSPPDGVVAPNIRRDLLNLLNEDVEVVDAFRLYRSARDDPEYLYNVADSHWAPRAMRLMAKELADRLQRYEFGAKARDAAPIAVSKLVPFGCVQSGWAALKPHQERLARAAMPKVYPQAFLANGSPLPDDPRSPVIVVGHSYVNFFREEVMKELNLETNTIAAPGFTTQFFADFLREPEKLSHCKVLIWITTEGHMTVFKTLPPEIAVYAEGSGSRTETHPRP
jgi:hypothetical protein